MKRVSIAGLALIASAASGCGLAGLRLEAADSDAFVVVRSSRVALVHVTVVDGTGSAAREDQTVVIENGRIAAVGPASKTAVPAAAEVLDLRGYTVIPGLVGMHNHLFYATDNGRLQVPLPRTFARLYLAAGVTTIRTAGAIDLEPELAIKRDIEAGREVGPRIHLSSHYLDNPPSIDALVRAIEAMAAAGVTSLKAYTRLRRDELAAAIETAHRLGLKVTGHLCAVGFREAASLGIDNLEHGLLVDTEFYSRRVDGVCPDQGAVMSELARMDEDDPHIQETIRQLVSRGVAITSTLAVYETFTARDAFYDHRLEQLLSFGALYRYRKEIARRKESPAGFAGWEAVLFTEMLFERRFARAGGLLMAGADPTGWGAIVAGLGDQRNVELLVEAGFTPEQAIQIATANGAKFLGEADRVGMVRPGLRADLVVLKGHLPSRMRTIRNVEIVFKDGVGFDSLALMRAEQGNVGGINWRFWKAVALGPAVVAVLVALRWAFGRKRARRQ